MMTGGIAPSDLKEPNKHTVRIPNVSSQLPCGTEESVKSHHELGEYNRHKPVTLSAAKPKQQQFQKTQTKYTTWNWNHFKL
jgi:hypothetical protein